jgi:L-threonylcarbamoyladenylate synthase
MAEISDDITKAAALLNEGKLVAIPTETVYGLAGNALDPLAVSKIFEVKNRPSFDPLIIHIASIDRLGDVVAEVPDAAIKLAKQFWPGPLTLLLPRKAIIPDIVTSGLDRVAVRIPAHPLSLELLGKLSFPLAAPSANPFGYISPTSARHVNDQLGNKLDFILDGGLCTVGIESTIVGFEGNKTLIYRLGGTSVEDIEAVVGEVDVKPHSSSNPAAPGMLKSHYAPRKKVVIGQLDQLISAYKDQKPGIITFNSKLDGIDPSLQIQLSADGNLNEAAVNLFAALRALDGSECTIILAELVPDKGLGKAINDRLKRASAE